MSTRGGSHLRPRIGVLLGLAVIAMTLSAVRSVRSLLAAPGLDGADTATILSPAVRNRLAAARGTGAGRALSRSNRTLDNRVDPSSRIYYTPGSVPNPLNVEFQVCTDNGFSSSGPEILLGIPGSEAPEDVTENFIWDEEGENQDDQDCIFKATADGDIPLALGTTTIEIRYCDAPMNSCYSVDAWYEVRDTSDRIAPAAAPLPTIPVVAAVAPASGATPAAAAVTHRFLVRNRKSNQRQFQITRGCTGAATCVASSWSLSVAAGADSVVSVTHSIGGGSGIGSSGTVVLSAEDNSDALHAGSDTVRVLVGPAAPTDLPAVVSPALQARELCVRAAAGPGAVQCGDLLLAHALPSVRVLGTTRTPTLLYNSATADPFPIIPVNVTLGATSDQVEAVLTVDGTARDTISVAAWAQSETRRLLLGFRATSLATGLYPYTIEVRRVTGGTSVVQETVTGELAIVNRGASGFGPGWWLAGLEQLLVVSGNRRLWIGGDGSTRVYATAGTNTWAAPALDAPDTLTFDTPSSNYCRKLPGRACVVFDVAGRHIATRGRLSMTNVNSWGFRTNFKYGSGAPLDTIEIPLANGSSDRYVFNYTSGKLASVTAPLNAGVARVVTITQNGNGQTASIGDPDTTGVAFTYVAGSNRIDTVRNRMDAPTVFSYDAGNKVSQVSVQATATQWITTNLQAFESRGFASGAGGTPVTADKAYTWIDGPRSDVADSTLIWVNGYGAPRRMRDALGHATNLSYNPSLPALVTEIQDPAGLVTVATYDTTTGHMLTQAVRSPYGNADSALTRFYWNTWDQVDSIVPAVGPTVSFAYHDTTGNRLWQQTGPDSAARVRFTYYDTSGSQHHAGLLRNVMAPGVTTDSVVYDTKRGNLLEYHAPGSPQRFTTRFWQDSIGRPVLVASPIDTLEALYDSTRTVYDIMDRVTRTETKARIRYSTDPWQTAVVETSYDWAGRPIEVRRSSVPDTAQVDELTTAWVYDSAGRRQVETYGTEATARSDSTSYDAAGNPVRVRTRRGHIITMRYDALGRLLERVVPGVIADRVCYEEVYGPEQSSSCEFPFPMYPNNNRGVLIPAEVTRYAYDHGGRIVRALNNDAEIVRSYYRNGQLQTDELHIRSVDRSTTTPYVMGHTYDLAGRDTAFSYPGGTDRARYTYADSGQGQLASVIDPSGDVFGFIHDAGGRVRVRSVTPATWSVPSFVDTSTYDALGRLASRVEWRTAATSAGDDRLHSENGMRYDARGRLLALTIDEPNVTGTVHEADYVYSGLGALITLEQELLGGGSAPSEHWVTDALGHRVWRTSPEKGRNPDGDTPAPKHYSYEGDRLMRVRVYQPNYDAIYPDSSMYEYDDAGNQIHERTEMRRYRLGQSNPMLAAKIAWNYYGADQRLRTAQRHDATYNPDNQAAVPTRRGVFEEYRYDPLGRRVMVYARRDTTFVCNITGCENFTDVFVWSGDQLIQETHRGAARRYVHGAGIDRPLKIGSMIPHADYRGVYDGGSAATGDAITGVDYPGRQKGAFRDEGVPRIEELYASLLQDQTDASGLVYRRNRYYDPQTGRFTQEDPIGLAGGLNLYGYAGGDPVNFSDPFGLCPGIPNTLQLDPTDCPPGYFTVLMAATGATGGGLAGATAGAVGCSPSGPGLLVCAAGGAAAGAAAGGWLGLKLGSALDLGVMLAKVVDGANGGDDALKLPGQGSGWVKLRGAQGWRDADGNIWRKDMLHKDHWDVMDRRGNKIREVDFDGRQIWPDGPKNKNK